MISDKNGNKYLYFEILAGMCFCDALQKRSPERTFVENYNKINIQNLKISLMHSIIKFININNMISKHDR